MRRLSMICACSIAMSASAAGAVTYKAVLTGNLVQTGVGVDPTFATGDLITLTSVFSGDRVFEMGGTCCYAGVYGLPVTGNEYWRIDVNGLTYSSFDEALDGTPIFLADDGREFGNPLMQFADGRILGFSGELIPVDEAILPILRNYKLVSGEGLYGNIAVTVGFDAVFDFEGSSVAAIPEPATWASMIVGFALVGATTRRRRTNVAVSYT